jgi:ABC-2 type transport system permease protein
VKAIFKHDLRAYFSSPLGYVFLMAFLLVMNIYFFSTCVYTGTNSLTSVFSFMIYMLIFMIPILTMRTFSEEYKLKTDQLLLTSPVRPSGIVLGKFFSCMVVFAIGLAFTLIDVIVIAATGTLNVATTVGNYIAIFGVAACYISIGLFISSLTENQLISCIATLGAFLALALIDMTYSLLNATWIKAVIYWISIFRRYNSFTTGVFSIADLFYYVSIAVVFVFLTVRVLEKKRWS